MRMDGGQATRMTFNLDGDSREITTILVKQDRKKRVVDKINNMRVCELPPTSSLSSNQTDTHKLLQVCNYCIGGRLCV